MKTPMNFNLPDEYADRFKTKAHSRGMNYHEYLIWLIDHDLPSSDLAKEADDIKTKLNIKLQEVNQLQSSLDSIQARLSDYQEEQEKTRSEGAMALLSNIYLLYLKYRRNGGSASTPSQVSEHIKNWSDVKTAVRFGLSRDDIAEEIVSKYKKENEK